MLLTVAPLAIVVVMMVVLQYRSHGNLPSRGFWIWFAAAAAFVGVTLWQAHAAGTPLLPKASLGQIGPYLITAVLLVAIWWQMQARVRRVQAGLPPVPRPTRFQIWWRWFVLALVAGFAILFVVESLTRRH